MWLTMLQTMLIRFDFPLTVNQALEKIEFNCAAVEPDVKNFDPSGPCLNIKMSSYQYRDPHVKDKTVLRPSYL